jgi:hypothetical protein
MQYRLSTIFLIFFVLAASLSLFNYFMIFGLWTALMLCIAGFCLNKTRTLGGGIATFAFITVLGIALPWHALSFFLEEVKKATCKSRIHSIGRALSMYEQTNKHFPPAYTCDKDGKPLFSWLVEILPDLGCGDIYDTLHKDEPWNSQHNFKVLSKYPLLFKCCSTGHSEYDSSSNFMAFEGPGMLFSRDGKAKRIEDFPLGTRNTMMLVEVIGSTKHWAEPYVLTSEEVLENTRTRKGPRIATRHSEWIFIERGDSSLSGYPSKMPLSNWRKILSGEIPLHDPLLEHFDPNAPDMIDVYVDPTPFWPNKVGRYFSIVVWLFAVALLFHRALKSRKKAVAVDMPLVPVA